MPLEIGGDGVELAEEEALAGRYVGGEDRTPVRQQREHERERLRGERVRDVPRLNEQSRRLAIASFYIETLEAPPREEWSGADGCRRVRGSSRTPTNSLSRSRRSVVRMEPWSLGLAAGADTVRRLPSIAVSNAEVGIASRAPAKRMKPAVGGSIQAHWHCATSSQSSYAMCTSVWHDSSGVFFVSPASFASRAASTTTPSMIFTFPIGRGLIVLSRSTHEIIFALIFVATLGLGPLPGILALACRSIGFMSKTTAEAMENVDRGPVEAIAATGAGTTARFLFGVVPQVFPIFLGNAIFAFDANVRRAAILGMVGAGGIGLHFSEQMRSYNYGNAGACVLAVVVLVIVGEIISNRIRTKLISG